MKLNLLGAEPGMKRVECSGDVTVLDFATGANPLEAVVGEEGFGCTILLDLAKAPYIDSSGIGWLIQSHRRARQAGGRLVVHSIPPMVNHCFRVLRMNDVLDIAADEAAALQLAHPVMQ
jgi:anti-anti-sigma factor